MNHHDSASLFEDFTKQLKTTLKHSFEVSKTKSDLPLHHVVSKPAQPYKAYSNIKALHPSLLKHHYQIAGQLLKDGYSDPHGYIKQNSKTLFSMMLLDLTENVSDYVKSPLGSTLHKIQTLLETIEVFAKHCGGACLIPDLVQMNNTEHTTYSPLSVMLKVYGSLAPDQKLMSMLKQTANVVSQVDSFEAPYLYAKYLLHMFPTGKSYEVSAKDTEFHLQSEGCYSLFTTAFAKASLEKFVEKLHHDDSSTQEIAVFSKLVSIFEQATTSCENRVSFETAQSLHEHYHQGSTVLLPSGWKGHFFDIALSKAQALYLFANSGENVNPENITGDTFRHLATPNEIDAEFMYDVLTNTQKEFEQPLLQHYGISEPVDVIECSAQKYNNCAWESHRNAIEGLLFIELLNQHVDCETAKSLAKTYYQHWDNFHGEFVVDTYMNNQPSLPVQALIDVLHECQHDAHNQHTHVIEKALNSPLYADEYLGWADKIELPSTHLETVTPQETSPTTLVSPADATFVAPHIEDQASFCPIISPLSPIEIHPDPILVC